MYKSNNKATTKNKTKTKTMMPTKQPAYATLSQAPSLTVRVFLCAVVLGLCHFSTLPTLNLGKQIVLATYAMAAEASDLAAACAHADAHTVADAVADAVVAIIYKILRFYPFYL